MYHPVIDLTIFIQVSLSVEGAKKVKAALITFTLSPTAGLYCTRDWVRFLYFLGGDHLLKVGEFYVSPRDLKSFYFDGLMIWFRSIPW